MSVWLTAVGIIVSALTIFFLGMMLLLKVL
jgi:hypothetical protein